MAVVKRLTWRDMLMFSLAIVVALLVWKGGTNKEATFRAADRSACVRIEALKVGFRDSLQRALSTLDQYAYYREHPEEKAKAIREIHRQLRLYAPIACD